MPKELLTIKREKRFAASRTVMPPTFTDTVKSHDRQESSDLQLSGLRSPGVRESQENPTIAMISLTHRFLENHAFYSRDNSSWAGTCMY